ncbi:hypothetical protein I4U23_011221 [Adineta vaga]|nr:hypothetical protein I4U23_011221 [Adineta vaga]
MASPSPMCGICHKKVDPKDGIECLDTVSHKECLKCRTCGMILTVRTIKGYDSLMCCNIQCSKGKLTFIKDETEMPNSDAEESDDSGSTSSTTFNRYQIFVWSLPLNMSDRRLYDTLREVFSEAGHIKINERTNKSYIYLFKDKLHNSEFRGMATITFEKEESIKRAIEKFNGHCVSRLNNYRIFVKESETSSRPRPQPDLKLLQIPRSTGHDYSKQPVVLRKKTIHSSRETNVTSQTYIPTDYYIIVDNSNVFIGAQTIYDKETKSYKINPAIRVNNAKLANELERGKVKIDIKTRLVGGSEPPKTPRVWEEWESCGYTCKIGERSITGKESHLDDMLHAQIFHKLLGYNETAITNRGRTLVLVTETVLTRGWNVELWSWKQSLSSTFFEIQKVFPNQMNIKYLDSYRDEITFEEKYKKK